MLSLTTLALLSAVVAILWWQAKIRTRNRTPFPPSPHADPVIGHVRYLPKGRSELAFINWGKELNTDILYLNLLGQHAIILFKLDDAIQLLDKAGAKYNDRPRFDFFVEAGWDTSLTFMSSGPHLRKHRRMFQNALTPSNCFQYQDAQTQEARKLVKRLIESPGEWELHLVTFAVTVILRIAYGITVTGIDDPYVKLALNSSKAVERGGSAGTSLVDLFPVIRKLPTWVKFIPSLKLARDCRVQIVKMQEIPYEVVKREMVEGTAPPSFTKRLLEETAFETDVEKADTKNKITEADIKGAAGTIFGAGTETTWTTLAFFILHMIQNPDVQKRAQEEVDRVVGPDRLPTFEDQPKLPYVERVFTLVFASAKAINLDKRVYRDPEIFNPDRYLPISEGGAGEPFPIAQFGFGRRICPGAYLGQASLWIAITTLFATLEFRKPRDENGVEYMPCPGITTGFTSRPEAFNCSIEPRSEKAAVIFTLS
ncbi:hypothetical protein G7Y89_g14583 [Cudoniella acicularis]|uniref:Cytochrome P450 n=1 Tax=Cudoniella acicularis TaxID=354080 RepID=A0A8H4QZ77_9HELO|nr:hypothetical protein G7Y89_g14583 [Cudoniella acicularis]